MKIGVLGRGLPAPARRACEESGIRFVPSARAELRLYVDANPPTKPPVPPWLWISPKKIDPSDAAAVVLLGAYDVATIGPELPVTVQRRCAELRVRIEPAIQPVGFVGKSEAA